MICKKNCSKTKLRNKSDEGGNKKAENVSKNLSALKL